MANKPGNANVSLLPFSTIEAASSGDVDAINAVLRHYETLYGGSGDKAAL